MTPSATTSAPTAGNGEPLCNCGATTRSNKDPQRCINGHLLRGNRAAAIVGEHGAQFWREQNAARNEIIKRLLRDAGFANPDDAPYMLQIGMETIAESTVIKRMAYKRLLESGGPLSESGQPRRALVVWDKRADMQMRDMRNHMEEYIAAIRANGQSSGRKALEAEYQELTTDELIALTDSLGTQLRELKEQTDAARQSRSAFTDSQSVVPPVPHADATRSGKDPAFSRASQQPISNSGVTPANTHDSSSNSGASSAIRRHVGMTPTSAPSPEYSPESASSPAHSPSAPSAPSAEPANGSRPFSGSPEPVTIHDDPYARFRNV
jgi:hypothetical protein